MTHSRRTRDRSVLRRALARRLLQGSWLVLLSGLPACDALDNLLAVDLPEEVLAEDVEDPAYAGLLVEGVIADFECALSPTIFWGALLGDELSSGDDLGQVAEVERRDLQNLENSYWNSRSCDVGTGYRGNWIPLSVARWSADNTLGLLEGWSDAEVAGRDSLIAVAAAYSGYAHVLLAENFCSVTLDVGPEMTPAEVLERAESRFDRAIAAAEVSGTTTMLQLAHLGRARARLNLGRLPEAAADAEAVDVGFRVEAVYSSASPRTRNSVGGSTGSPSGGTVSVGGLYREMRFDGVADPRVPAQDAGILESSGNAELWYQTKYPDETASIPFARWEEAQLIIAEAAVAAGNLDEAIAIINDLHAAVGLPPFDSDDATKVLAQIIYERRAELFLEGQHLGDYRRYALPLDPVPGTLHVGDGRPYGGDRCFPVPDSERAGNPNI